MKNSEFFEIVKIEKRGVKDVKAAAKRAGMLGSYEGLKRLRLQREINTTPTPSVREFIHVNITRRLKEIATALPSTGYSMGSVKTASVLNFKGVVANIESYSGKYAGSEKYGLSELRLSPAEFRKIEVIGGMLTIKEKKLGKDLYKCRALTSIGRKQHFRLEWKNMLIFRDYHFMSEGAYKQEISEVRRKVIARDKEAAAAKRFERGMERYRAKALKCFYGIQHSLMAGNCEEGTMNFARKIIDLDKVGGVRGDVLIEMANKYGVRGYADRLIINKARQLAGL